MVWAGGGGNWQTAGSWSTLALPDSLSDVWIDGGKLLSSLVSLSNSTSVRSLAIDAADGLALADGGLLRIVGGAVVNDGQLGIHGSSSATGLRLSGSITLSGSGSTVLSGSQSFIGRASNASASLTIASGHTVCGNGVLGHDLVSGYALQSITNQGSLVAEGGTLYVYGNLSGGSVSARTGATFAQMGDSVQLALLDLDAGGLYTIVSGTLEADAVHGNWQQTSGIFVAGTGAGKAMLSGDYSLGAAATRWRWTWAAARVRPPTACMWPVR